MKLRWCISILLWVGMLFATNPAEQPHFKSADSSLAPLAKPFQLSTVQQLPDTIVSQRPVTYLQRLRQTGIIQPKNGYLVLALAANWTSFYLKGQADNAYGRYQRSDNLPRLRGHYNDARRLDNLATASLAISGVAFGIYFYLILQD